MRNASAVRRIVLSLTGIVLVALIIYAAYWHYVAGMLREQLLPWAQARATEGFIIHWDDAEVGGFPGSFRFDFTNLSFGTLRPVPVAVNAGSASAWAMPWNLKHWEFTTPGGARVVEPSGTAGFDMRRVDGAVDVEGRVVAAIDVTAVDLNGLGLAQGTKIGDAEAHIELPATPPRSHTDIALGLSLELSDATLPVAVPGFGNTLSGFSFVAQLKGALPPGQIVPALTHWRDDGGTIELQSLRLRWGSLLVDASGTLALDQSLQPEGAFSAVITGQDAAVDVAVKTGALKPSDAGTAKAVLGLLARPNGNGDKALTLPMTIQNQQLYLGPAKLANIPPIPWR
ncbi:MAG TPA: DUF2125 domain-containing protein [Stellaceae bacterium]|jgi:hypothetical protein|nr:DUF2125 domain-containing protein [Stellaceae bacterium]